MSELTNLVSTLTPCISSDLSFEEVGGSRMPFPDWATHLFQIGRISSHTSINFYSPLIVITLPTSAYASAIIASGVLNGSCERETKQSVKKDPTSISKELSPGDNIFLTVKSRPAFLAEFSKIDEQFISVITKSKSGKGKNKCLESFPISQLIEISPAGEIPKSLKFGTDLDPGSPFEADFYGDCAKKYLTHTQYDCGIIGNLTQLKIITSKCGYSFKYEPTKDSLLKDLLRFETETNAFRSSKTCLFSKNENRQVILKKVSNTSTLIFEAPQCWLIGPKSDFEGTSIILLDRTHYKYSDDAFELKEAFKVTCKGWTSSSLTEIIPDLSPGIGGFILWNSNENH